MSAAYFSTEQACQTRRTDMLMLDRRTLLRSGSAAVGAIALAPAALARAPQPGKAQPGFYRFKLGAIEITVVSDGTLAFPAETLWGDRAEDATLSLSTRATSWC
jgi:hypothetical protein